MAKGHSETKQVILDVASQLILEQGSAQLRVADVATRAHVGIPTIYYHFESRARLVAEAQAANYFRVLEPLHHCLEKAEQAVLEQDQVTFWSAIGDDMELAWVAGRPEDGWGIVKLLLDVWSDPKTQSTFSHLLDIQFDRWINAAERAKGLGWLDEEIDAKVLITSFWAASIGQAIISNSSRMDSSPQSVRDFYVRVMTARTRDQVSD